MFAQAAAYCGRLFTGMEVGSLVAWSIFLEHLAGLALLWAWVFLAGLALLPLLRIHVGIVGAPLLGVVFWTIALYVFPFAGGLDIAAALVLVMAAIAFARFWRSGAVFPRVRLSTILLVVGSLPYTTTLIFHHVPLGMDASMHATAAALIGYQGGLPTSYAPFLPDLAFPPMNLGLPAVAGVAIRWGGDTASVMLASHHLTFTLLILATYSLLRMWVHRNPAALLAVISVWTARGSQASLEWGGFPTVMSVAVGVFAARLLLQHGRSSNWRLSLTAGATIAAIPLIHGVGGGTWLYCVGPWVALAAILNARSKGTTWRGLALCGLTAAAVLGIYQAVGKMTVDASDMTWTQPWQEDAAPLGEYAWLSAFDFIRKDSGSVIVGAGWIACAALVWRRQGWAAGLLMAAWFMMATVVANSRWWVLPASFLLYPERAIYWAAPLSAVGLALAWRAAPAGLVEGGLTRVVLHGIAVGLLGVAAVYQNQFYQKIVREDYVNADGWAALVWARDHLKPDRDYVLTRYNSTGSFLPAIAQVACSGSHNHGFIEQQVRQACGRRSVTHVMIDQARAPEDVPPGEVVFQNQTITIVAIHRSAGAQARRPDVK